MPLLLPPLSSRRQTHASRGRGGFTMVEVMVGLTILLIVLLLGMVTIEIQHQARATLATREQAHRLLQTALETLRVGGITLASGPVHWNTPPPAANPNIALDLAVVGTGTPGLVAVALTARWQVDGTERTMRVDSMLWDPALGGGAP